MRKKPIIIPVIVLPLLLLAGGRLYAWRAASEYGTTLIKAISAVSTDMFANTASVRGLLDHPEISVYPERIRRVSFLGRDYLERIAELNAGLIHCSEQMSLPQAERFASPPALGPLKINPGDRSDQATADAGAQLLVDYVRRLHPWVPAPKPVTR